MHKTEALVLDKPHMEVILMMFTGRLVPFMFVKD